RICVALGKRLHADGRLGEPREELYLSAEVARGLGDGRASTRDSAGVVASWSRELGGFREKAEPADRFATRGAEQRGKVFDAAHATVVRTGDALKGIGCGPGVVGARGRVIIDPRNAVIESGEILVAPRTDPGWIMLFPAAAGLLVEHGSLLSHSAIVAREMGIPAIVSIDGVTVWAKTGDWLELDGATGVVRKVAGAAEGATQGAAEILPPNRTDGAKGTDEGDAVGGRIAAAPGEDH